MGAPALVATDAQGAAAPAAALAELQLRPVTPPSPAEVETFRPPAPPPALDAEKLVVYRVALELQVLCATLVPAHERVLHDQLGRASLSIVLTIAEGAGRRSRRDKRRFYVMARGSAMEVAAGIDVLRIRHLAPERACAEARSLALRVVQMLTKLDRALA